MSADPKNTPKEVPSNESQATAYSNKSQSIHSSTNIPSLSSPVHKEIIDTSSTVNTSAFMQGAQRLLIHDVRNIEYADLNKFSQFNIFFGANGSGKTSVLEALAFVGTAKSFRSNQLQRFIRNEQPSCSVFVEHTIPIDSSESSFEESLSIGVQRDRQGTRKIKVQGENVVKLIDLAHSFPFQLIYHKTFQILHDGPSIRRQLLDWGVFHVEHEFRSLWLRLQRAVKQRNNLLRSQANEAVLSPWNKELIDLANSINSYRTEYLKQLKPLFVNYLNDLLPEFSSNNFQLRYQTGWPKQDSYEDALNKSQDRDLKQGYTQYGPHKAQINVYIDNVPVADSLSRGQIKMLIIAFKLAQAKLLYEEKGTKCLFLVDDLPSELDSLHLGLVCAALAELETQVFVTCIEKNALSGLFNSTKSRLFHVEHGKITPLD